MPTTCRSGAAPSCCSAPIRSPSRFRPATRHRSCSTSPPRSCPTARSRPMRCRAATCRKAGWWIAPPVSRSPFGGYKGSGLALMLGLLAGVLNGAAFGRDVVDFNADLASQTNTGQFMVALDIARFLPLEAFKSEIDRHLRDLKNSQVLPGVDAIRLPGERRLQCQIERARDGVPILPAVLAQLDALAKELAIPPLASRSAR